MVVSAICFTRYGRALLTQLADRMAEEGGTAGQVKDAPPADRLSLQLFCKSKYSDNEGRDGSSFHILGDQSVTEWAAEQLSQKRGLLFVGATGIAVRAIAPSVVSKLTDPPVLVMDDCGEHIIPLLSGHMGGANELACRIAQLVGAVPVITTSTDKHGMFAVDVFARHNHLAIEDKSCIAAVSAKLLAGDKITMVVDDTYICMEESSYRQFKRRHNAEINMFLASEWDSDIRNADLWIGEEAPENSCHIPHLLPRSYVLGMGCRRGKAMEELKGMAEELLQQAGISWERVGAIASIDRKADEEGLLMLAEQMRIPFVTFPAEELQAVPGEFSESEFVQKQMGVGNVCERAAACAAGADYELLIRKQAKDGMTASLAKGRFSLKFME